MLRILTGIDVPFLPFGGSPLVCNDWYSQLPPNVEVRFLTLPNPNGEHWWSMDDVVMLDVKKARTADGFQNYVDRLRYLVQEQVDQYRPDIIHCQHLNYGLSRAFVDLQLTIPRLGICHGTDVQAAVSQPFFRENLTHICDRLDGILFPNQAMYEDFTAVYNTQKPHYISPLGVPDSLFGPLSRADTFTSGRPLRVLYAGRLLDWKGADIAVKAMAHIHHAMQLTVVGNEDQAGYLAAMHEVVRRDHLEGQVQFIPQLPREQLIHAFDAYDVIVFPSRRLEAFSLTVVEAQARGLPVVYYAGGGIGETVGESGLRLAEATPEQLAVALDLLYEHPEKLSELRKEGLKNAARYKLSVSRQRLLDISAAVIRSYSGAA